MLEIQTATSADEEKINELFEEMLSSIYHTSDVKGYEYGYLEQYWNGSENRIFVAKDNEVRAFLSVQVFRDKEPYLYLDDFSVTDGYRNKGIGKELMLRAESYAKEIRISTVELHVEKTNEKAFKFYERLGYSILRDDGERYLMYKNV